MGATNRPQELDSAIMRRMPTRFHINQPVSGFDCYEQLNIFFWQIFICDFRKGMIKKIRLIIYHRQGRNRARTP